MPLDLETLPLAALWIAFAAAAVVIMGAGIALASRADSIADRTGLGEALIGAVLLGGSTSLSGIVTSVTAAWQGHPTLAISNALGGIAIQTAFLAIADITYRRANLEHAAASLANVSQSALLVVLLAVPVVAFHGPDVSAWGVHPATVVLVALYLGGLRLVAASRKDPMWRPRTTRLTVPDVPEEAAAGGPTTGRLFLTFALFAGLLAGAGFVLSHIGIAIAGRTNLAESSVGALLTAAATSLPELVTTLAAVRRGALTLAVGGVIGGNAFDTLFLAFSDVAYRDGSIYHRMTSSEVFIVGITIMMTGVLVLGLLQRERQGVARIGFESAIILVLYLIAVVVVLS